MATPSRYPFPAEEDAAQTKWWGRLNALERDTWAPFLRVMTPAERRQYHDDRRFYAGQFKCSMPEDPGPFGGAAFNERSHFDHMLRSRWEKILGRRMHNPRAA